MLGHCFATPVSIARAFHAHVLSVRACVSTPCTEEEYYLDLLPWQWLASSNQNFLITERRRHYLRYAGALTFFEINGPSVYKVRTSGLSHFVVLQWHQPADCGIVGRSGRVLAFSFSPTPS